MGVRTREGLVKREVEVEGSGGIIYKHEGRETALDEEVEKRS